MLIEQAVLLPRALLPRRSPCRRGRSQRASPTRPGSASTLRKLRRLRRLRAPGRPGCSLTGTLRSLLEHTELLSLGKRIICSTPGALALVQSQGGAAAHTGPGRRSAKGWIHRRHTKTSSTWDNTVLSIAYLPLACLSSSRIGYSMNCFCHLCASGLPTGGLTLENASSLSSLPGALAPHLAVIQRAGTGAGASPEHECRKDSTRHRSLRRTARAPG